MTTTDVRDLHMAVIEVGTVRDTMTAVMTVVEVEEATVAGMTVVEERVDHMRVVAEVGLVRTTSTEHACVMNKQVK